MRWNGSPRSTNTRRLFRRVGCVANVPEWRQAATSTHPAFSLHSAQLSKTWENQFALGRRAEKRNGHSAASIERFSVFARGERVKLGVLQSADEFWEGMFTNKLGALRLVRHAPGNAIRPPLGLAPASSITLFDINFAGESKDFANLISNFEIRLKIRSPLGERVRLHRAARTDRSAALLERKERMNQSLKDQFLRQIDDALGLQTEMRTKTQDPNMGGLPSWYYEKFNTAALAAIERIAGVGSVYFKQATAALAAKQPPRPDYAVPFRNVRSSLEACATLWRQIIWKQLPGLSTLRFSADFLEMAQHLLTGLHGAVAVIAGSPLGRLIYGLYVLTPSSNPLTHQRGGCSSFQRASH